jgi:hypothetical protein
MDTPRPRLNPAQPGNEVRAHRQPPGAHLQDARHEVEHARCAPPRGNKRQGYTFSATLRDVDDMS